MKPFAKTLCSVLLTSCFGFAVSHAGWIENGVPLTRQWGATGQGVIVSDGSSGAIIAYQACHQGVACIIAQRVNSSGVVLWGEEGVNICAAAQSPQYPQIASDGAGGAIVTWDDHRSGNCDIYAQRINASGDIQWTVDGVPLCTATGNQVFHRLPKTTSDGAGGVIVTWADYRSGNSDIYAQRVNASGVVEWTLNGVLLCTATRDQEYPQITPDGFGGAIVAWTDSRSGYSNIYAQRLTASGGIQWASNGVPLCTATGGQEHPQITSDGAGGAIVTWRDYRGGNSDIYAQRVNASGVVEWTLNGVPLCTAMEGQEGPQIASDGAGGAIVTWYDYRSGDSNVYAQRLTASGGIQWTVDGIPLCIATGDQGAPQITSDDVGGAIVTWYDYRSGYSNIYAQRLTASGAVQWIPDGISLSTTMGDLGVRGITSDGAGGAIVTWMDILSENPGIYAQRVNASGTIQWTVDGVPLCTGTGYQERPQIISDGAGGAIVTWTDSRSGYSNIYAQRLTASGGIQWTVDGIPLCTATGGQDYPQITSDGGGGAIVTWDDARQGSPGIYAQRVNASGTIQWMTDGTPLCTATWNYAYPQITPDGSGGAIVTWCDYRSGSNYRVYAQRVNASGTIQWMPDGVALCPATEDQTYPRITSDGAGGAIVAWMDFRSGDINIYVQRVNASGALQWSADALPLCKATGDQWAPRITSDGAGGAIVTWEDPRSGNSDIYAQLVDASGAVQWTPDGVPLCTAAGNQRFPQIDSDGAGGAIATWHDARDGSSGIYVQRLNTSGTVHWASDGVPLCTGTGYQERPQIISDGAGGAIVTWEDGRGGSPDIYVQRVNASGVIPDSSWVPDGVPLCTATGDQDYPQITSDGAGGAIIAWEDLRCGRLTYAQRIRASGQIVATTLQNYSAALEGTSIRINWAVFEIDEGARFLIFRASAPDWEYTELKGTTIDKDRLSFTFTDETCLPGSCYKYRVECQVAGRARRILFETDTITMPPLPVTLYQNCPNPFNPQTVIRFYLPEAQEVFLDVYDVAGERVARLAEGKTERGFHEVRWDGRNGSGRICSSGVYFSRLKAGKSTISRKMLIMR